MTRSSLPTRTDRWAVSSTVIAVLLFAAAVLGIVSAVTFRTFNGLSLFAVLLVLAALAIDVLRRNFR